MRHASRKAVLVVATLLAAGGLSMLGGCSSRSLFNDEDKSSARLKYWENDSAVDSARNRKVASDMGYGGGAGGSQ